MVKSFLQKAGSKIKKLKDNPFICMDKGLAFKEEDVKEALKAGGAKNFARCMDFSD